LAWIGSGSFLTLRLKLIYTLGNPNRRKLGTCKLGNQLFAKQKILLFLPKLLTDLRSKSVNELRQSRVRILFIPKFLYASDLIPPNFVLLKKLLSRGRGVYQSAYVRNFDMEATSIQVDEGGIPTGQLYTKIVEESYKVPVCAKDALNPSGHAQWGDPALIKRGIQFVR